MRRRTPHPAILVVAITFLAMLFSAGLRSAPGVMMQPLELYFGWDRATISFGAAIGILLYGLVGPFAAALMMSIGIRRTMIGGLALVAIPASWDYVHFMKREGTPVLGIPFMWVFLPFVILLLALVVRSVLGMWRAWQGLDLEDAGVPS